MHKDVHPIITGLRRVRVVSRISQEKVALKAGLCTTQINSYESGRNIPSILKLAYWAQSLGYEIVLRRIEEK